MRYKKFFFDSSSFDLLLILKHSSILVKKFSEKFFDYKEKK